jgi:Mg-chelatase subunit ChlD
MSMRGASSRTLKLDNAKLERKVVALRARLGATRSTMKELQQQPWVVGATAAGEPDRFVQLVVQPRAGFGVLFALDASGQVWERRTVFDQTTKQTTEEWWEAIGMQKGKPS